jgi:hypothetical protein
MVKVMRVDGSIVDLVTPTGVVAFADLQAAVGGYVQVVECDNGRTMVIDEEGKCKGKPLNRAATEIADLFVGDFIVGDAVVMDPEDADRILN